MKLKSLLENISSVEISGNLDVEIHGVHSDSRRIRKGDLFIAMQGEKVDGHQFVNDVISKGASAIVCEKAIGGLPSIAQIRVSDARGVMAQIASRFHGNPSRAMRVIGITGTNGKTTTSYLTAAILEAAGIPSGVIGTLAYRIGNRELPAPNTTPLADEIQSLMAQMVQAGMKAVVMEVSSHSLVQHRVDEIEWDAGVFTNLTQDHLDYHKTMEAYFEAKQILFKKLGTSAKKSVAILNLDDPKSRALQQIVGKNVSVTTYGLNPEADVRAEGVEQSVQGCRFMMVTAKGRWPVSTPLCGAHNVLNCLAAAATALTMGIDPMMVVKGIESVKNVAGRLEAIDSKSLEVPFAIFVDYAHTDDALKNVLQTLRPLTKGRLITVFGCGGNRDPLKRPLMGCVAGEMSDWSIVTNDNPRFEDPALIAEQVVKGFGAKKNFEVVLDRRGAIRKALESAKVNDVVLLAGKGHEAYQEISGTKTPFDDRKIAREVLEELFRQRGGPWKN